MRKVVIALFLIMVSVLFSAPANMAVTVTGGTETQDGTTWATAFAYSDFITDLEGSAEAGDVYYLESGTYDMTGAVTVAGPGTAALPIRIVGVKSSLEHEPDDIVYSDYAFGEDQPLLNSTDVYGLTFADYYNLENIQVISEDGVARNFNLIVPGSYDVFNNCTIWHKTDQPSKSAIYGGNYCKVVKCTIKCDNGNAILSGAGVSIVDSKLQDSAVGLSGNSYNNLIACIISGNTVGISLAATHSGLVMNSSFYANGIHIDASTAHTSVIVNNIFSQAVTKGLDWDTDELNNTWEYNILNNSTNATNVTKALIGTNILVDSGTEIFTDGDNGDFSLLGDTARNTGMMPVSTFKWNIGADQTDAAAAGSGASKVVGGGIVN